MNQDPVTVERIDVLKTLPAIHLLQSLRMSFRLRILLPCLVGTACWLIVGEISGLHALSDEMSSRWTDVRSPIFHCVTVSGMLLTNSHPDLFFSLLASLLLDAIVIAFVGTAVARATATEFCTATRVGAIAGIRFSSQRALAWLLSTGLAAAIVTALMAAICCAAWLASLGAAGTTIVSLLWPLVFLMAVLTALTAIVCGFSWLLSLAAIGTDQCSGSDALSRGINYVLSHKLTSAIYLALTVLLAWIAYGTTKSILAAGEQLLRNRLPAEFFKADTVGDTIGQQALFYWNRLLTELLPDAVHLGAFLSAITLTYILLRKAEDAVQIREIDGAQSSEAKA